MRLKKLLLPLMILLCASQTATAQNAEVKINVLAGAVTILNPSIELGFAESSAFTMDYVGAYAKEDFMNTGYPFIMSMAVFGYRHYFAEDYKGFFVGGDFGLDVFRMNKNIIPLVDSNSYDDIYDVGKGYFLGATLGYKYQISPRFRIEASVTGGWHLTKHERYTGEGVRFFEFNGSGEWTPYKAGIYLSYKLWDF